MIMLEEMKIHVQFIGLQGRFPKLLQTSKTTPIQNNLPSCEKSQHQNYNQEIPSCPMIIVEKMIIRV